MKGHLPKTLYEREKFAFISPPATANKDKWSAMMELAQEHLCDNALLDSGLLDRAGVQRIISEAQSESTPRPRKVQLDAVINHILGVQMLYQHFVSTDVPAVAEAKAKELGWTASANIKAAG